MSLSGLGLGCVTSDMDLHLETTTLFYLTLVCCPCNQQFTERVVCKNNCRGHCCIHHFGWCVTPTVSSIFSICYLSVSLRSGDCMNLYVDFRIYSWVFRVGDGADKAQSVITMHYSWQGHEITSDECMCIRQSLTTVWYCWDKDLVAERSCLWCFMPAVFLISPYAYLDVAYLSSHTCCRRHPQKW